MNKTLVLRFVTPENLEKLKKLLPEGLGGNTIDWGKQLKIIVKKILNELEEKLLATQKTSNEHKEKRDLVSKLEAEKSLDSVIKNKIKKIIKLLTLIKKRIMKELEKKEWATSENLKKKEYTEKNIADNNRQSYDYLSKKKPQQKN